MTARAAQRRENIALIKAWGHAVYSGREQRGNVYPCDSGEWLAETEAGQVLGTFRNEKAAVAAVLSSGRRL
jgi:hypothetical protein